MSWADLLLDFLILALNQLHLDPRRRRQLRRRQENFEPYGWQEEHPRTEDCWPCQSEKQMNRKEERSRYQMLGHVLQTLLERDERKELHADLAYAL